MSSPDKGPAWWQLELNKPEAPKSRFDLLPPELVEKILFNLPTKDVCSMASTSRRLEAIVKANSLLSLHLLDSKDLAAKAAKCSETLKFVLGNNFLQEKLSFNLLFERTVSGIESFSRLNICFYSWPKQDPIDGKVARLLHVANQLSEPSGEGSIGVKQMALVLADSDEDAVAFHHALVSANIDSDICLAAVNRDQELKWRNKTHRFFVCSATLNIDFPLSIMANILSFRRLRDVHDFLELESFSPESIFHFVSLEQDQLLVVSNLIRFLKPFCEGIPGQGHRLKVDRSFYRSRSRYQTGPVQPMFS
jgi:hypothetical protein